MTEINMQELITKGVMVIPYPENIRKQFNLNKYLSEQKEYVHINQNTNFVMGAFGAFGNPSSFHHPEIRKLRLNIYNFIKTYFSNTFHNKYLECIVDRFAIRRPDTSLSPETWHRDISNMKNNNIIGSNDDLIFGGWVNLDDNHTQQFSCVPCTHDNILSGTGFTRLSKDDALKYKSIKEKINVPPNHLIIFNEKIIHQVLPIKYKNYSYRLFMKYRITSNPDTPLINTNHLLKVIENQDIFPLNVEQQPPMYAKLHAVNWKTRLNDFSENIKDEFIDKKLQETKQIKRVHRLMPSLKAAGYDLFPDYSEEEINMLLLQQI